MTSSADARTQAQLVDSHVAPTVGQIAVRSIPAVLVAVAGPPVVAVVLPSGTEDGWWFLAVFSLFALAGVVQFLVQPSQPRLDKRVSQQRWKWALSSVTKTRAVPVDPGVRANAAAVACTEIQMFVVLVSFILGVVVGMFIRPEVPWSSFLGAPIGMALVSAFRLRRSLAYLKVLHTQAQTDGQQSQRQ